MRHRRTNGNVLLLTRVIAGTSDDIDLAAELRGKAAATLGRHRGNFAPAIGGGGKFPRAVRRVPVVTGRSRLDPAAKHVNLAVVPNHRLVMNRHRNVRLLGPTVGRRVVLIEPTGEAARSISAVCTKDVQLAGHNGGPDFLRRL